jgi:hypothetical protein
MNDDELIATLREGIAGVRMDVPAETIVRRGRTIRTRRRIPGLTATLGVVAAAVVAVTTVLPPKEHPAAQPAPVQAGLIVVGHAEAALGQVLHENAVTMIQTLALAGVTVTASAQGRAGKGGAGKGRTGKGGAKRGQATLQIAQSSYYYEWNERRVTYSASDEQSIVYSGPDGITVTSPGRIGADWGYTVSPLRTVTKSVDYQHRTWSQVAQAGQLRVPPAKTPTCASVKTIVTEGNPAHWAVAVHKALGCGQYKSAGYGSFLGAHLIKLVPVHPGREAVALWVDPLTFLPVWVAVEARQRPGAPLRILSYQSVRWLAPTAANLAKLVVPIPPGFARVAPSL